MDKQNVITIYNDLDQKRYFIESENDHLLVNGEKTENINLIGSSEDQIFTLDRVPAGRGFHWEKNISCLLYTSPSPRDRTRSRMPSSA